MALTLMVLAAGMGSRYGGLKQIDPVGPSGETMLDYAVYDALQHGFTRVVFVIRREFESVFREQIGSRYAGRIAVDYVFQSVDQLPVGFAPVGGREKPWGTAHAVWCARDAVAENFVVINADDFYGADSFRRLADFLRSNPTSGAPRFAMAGYRLANTLSVHGAVSRGVCAVGPDGVLRSIVEQTQIEPTEVGPGGRFSGQEVVSLNCWGFTPALFVGLDEQLREFLRKVVEVPSRPQAGVAGVDPLKAEFYLPAAVATMISRGGATVSVLPTTAPWFGVTYREDRPRVTAAIAELVRVGQYPAQLFP